MTNPKMKDTVMGKRRKDKVTSSGITKQSQCNKEKYKTKYGTKKTGEGFAEQRKSSMVHKYRRLLKKEGRQHSEFQVKTQRIYEEAGQQITGSQQRKEGKKVSSFHKEELKWKNQKKEKESRRQALKLQQEEKEKALKKYKQNKRLVHKKLSKKTYKGQPNMAAQMEVLLKKIEASKS